MPTIFRSLFGPAPKGRAQENGGIYTANFRRHLLWIFGGTLEEVGYGLTVVCCQTKLLVRSLNQLVRSKFLRRSSCPCRPVGGGEVKAGNRHRNSATDETRGCWLASHRGADLQPRCRWRLAAAGPAPQTSVPATRFRRWSVPGPFLFNMYHNRSRGQPRAGNAGPGGWTGAPLKRFLLEWNLFPAWVRVAGF